MSAVLLTGATGFVGSHLRPYLVRGGHDVRCTSRRRGARAGGSGVEWVYMDLDEPSSIRPALEGMQAAVYLVHEMGQGPGYETRELRAARAFADAAASAGVERIVYLGGVAPADHLPVSRHLKSRLDTGRELRAGRVPVFELRASMIVGWGSTSFRIVRDLSARLPAMVLPRWLENRSQPIGIDDVCVALLRALSVPVQEAGPYDLPGPEALSGKEVLLRLAALRGTRPFVISVPVLTPRLSSCWLKLVSGADYRISRELVDGLATSLLPTGRSFWTLAPDHHLLSFDEAARRALREEAQGSVPAVLVERAVARISRAEHHP